MTMMGKLTALRKPALRLLAIVALAAYLIVLPAAPASSQSDCCAKCLDRFFQCDANNIVCCQIYNSCAQQCQGGCASCPDQ